jgi:hypothetical protein
LYGLGETSEQRILRIAFWIQENEDPNRMVIADQVVFNPNPATPGELQSVKNSIKRYTPFKSDAEIGVYLMLEQWKLIWINTKKGSWGWYLSQYTANPKATEKATVPWSLLLTNMALVGAGAFVGWFVFGRKPKKKGRK